MAFNSSHVTRRYGAYSLMGGGERDQVINRNAKLQLLNMLRGAA